MTHISDLRDLIPRLQQASPRVIFFDAMGTLFDLRHSVGDIYAAIATHHQVEVEPAAINQAFFPAFKAAPPLAFGNVPDEILKTREFEWWQSLARRVFEQMGKLQHFTDFEAYFEALYDHFLHPELWQVFPDVLPVLTACGQAQIPVSVISNFDSRLPVILDKLGLSQHFNGIFVSSQCQTAKPDRAIFQQALTHHQVEPTAAWHVGDSLRADYLGAQGAGLSPFLIQRAGTG